MKYLIFSLFFLYNTHFAFAEKQKEKEKVDIYFFNQVKDFASQVHVDEVDEETFIFNALNGAMMGLDPHSEFIKPQDYQQFKEKLEGEFSGVGIQIVKENNFVKVINPIEGTPAFKIGIKSGDYITHINGESTYKMQLDVASAKMRGKEGTKLELIVVREGEKEPLKFTITREKIKSQNVASNYINDFLILNIYSFTTQTGVEVKQAILKHKNAKGIIIDLRNNLGGQFNQSIIIADFFLPEGKIITTSRTRFKNQQTFEDKEMDLYCAKPKECDKITVNQDEFNSNFISTANMLVKEDVPVIVLINGASASASEVLAGALKDNKRAILVGELSFGKGVIQRIIPLNEGKNGAIKITTSQYYRPNKSPVQTLGIAPDVEVMSGKITLDDNKFKELFSQREKDLKNHTLAKNLEKAKQDSAEYKKEENDITKYYQDLQLFTAINILKAINIRN